MTKGAQAIINLCGVGQMVDDLLNKGYSIKVVGHSLGAGISCMIAFAKAKYSLRRKESEAMCLIFLPLASRFPLCGHTNSTSRQGGRPLHYRQRV